MAGVGATAALTAGRLGGVSLGGDLRRLQRPSVRRVERRRGAALTSSRASARRQRRRGSPSGRPPRAVADDPVAGSRGRAARSAAAGGSGGSGPAALDASGKAPSVSGPGDPGTSSPPGDVPSTPDRRSLAAFDLRPHHQRGPGHRRRSGHQPVRADAWRHARGRRRCAAAPSTGPAGGGPPGPGHPGRKRRGRDRRERARRLTDQLAALQAQGGLPGRRLTLLGRRWTRPG